MVSYAKARAESLVPASEVGFWDRPERLALMILCALVNRMPLALWILAIGPNITVIHRILQTWKQTEGSLRTAARQEKVSGAVKGLLAQPVKTSSRGKVEREP